MTDTEPAIAASRPTSLDVCCWQIVALGFLLFVTSIFCFAIDVGLSPIHFPAALFVVVSAGLQLSRRGRAGREGTRHAVVSQLLFLGCVGLSLVVADAFFDVTSDGQSYHQNAVLRFASGWQGREPLGDLRAEHFPHAAELPAAALVVARSQPPATQFAGPRRF